MESPSTFLQKPEFPVKDGWEYLDVPFEGLIDQPNGKNYKVDTFVKCRNGKGEIREKYVSIYFRDIKDVPLGSFCKLYNGQDFVDNQFGYEKEEKIDFQKLRKQVKKARKKWSKANEKSYFQEGEVINQPNYTIEKNFPVKPSYSQNPKHLVEEGRPEKIRKSINQKTKKIKKSTKIHKKKREVLQKNNPEIEKEILTQPKIIVKNDNNIAQETIKIASQSIGMIGILPFSIFEIVDDLNFFVTESLRESFNDAEKLIKGLGVTVEFGIALAQGLIKAAQVSANSFIEYINDLERLASGAITIMAFMAIYSFVLPAYALDAFYTSVHRYVVECGGLALKVIYLPFFILLNGYYKFVPQSTQKLIGQTAKAGFDLSILAGISGFALLALTYINPGFVESGSKVLFRPIGIEALSVRSDQNMIRFHTGLTHDKGRDGVESGILSDLVSNLPIALVIYILGLYMSAFKDELVNKINNQVSSKDEEVGENLESMISILYSFDKTKVMEARINTVTQIFSAFAKVDNFKNMYPNPNLSNKNISLELKDEKLNFVNRYKNIFITEFELDDDKSQLLFKSLSVEKRLLNIYDRTSLLVQNLLIDSSNKQRGGVLSRKSVEEYFEAEIAKLTRELIKNQEY